MAERVEFSGPVRRFKDDAPGGLAVVDVPAELVGPLGGRRQYRVTGTLNGSPYTGSAMLVAGRGEARHRARGAGRMMVAELTCASDDTVDSGSDRSSYS